MPGGASDERFMRILTNWNESGLRVDYDKFTHYAHGT